MAKHGLAAWCIPRSCFAVAENCNYTLLAGYICSSAIHSTCTNTSHRIDPPASVVPKYCSTIWTKPPSDSLRLWQFNEIRFRTRPGRAPQKNIPVIALACRKISAINFRSPQNKTRQSTTKDPSIRSRRDKNACCASSAVKAPQLTLPAPILPTPLRPAADVSVGPPRTLPFALSFPESGVSPPVACLAPSPTEFPGLDREVKLCCGGGWVGRKWG